MKLYFIKITCHLANQAILFRSEVSNETQKVIFNEIPIIDDLLLLKKSLDKIC